MPKGKQTTVLDLGTGSGAVAIAISYYRKEACVTAIDASSKALEIAKENAEKVLTRENNVSPIKFVCSDWYAQLQEQRFEIIVSNPPYIADKDPHLSEGDVRFEPAAALTSGIDGLDALRHIISEAPIHLHPGGWLMCEHGYDQAESIQILFREAGFTELFSAPDLSGIPRVTGGRLA